MQAKLNLLCYIMDSVMPEFLWMLEIVLTTSWLFLESVYHCYLQNWFGNIDVCPKEEYYWHYAYKSFLDTETYLIMNFFFKSRSVVAKVQCSTHS